MQHLSEASFYFLCVQLIGLVAFGIGAISYQFKDQRTMWALRVGGDTVWVVHYGLLGAMTPALTVVIAVARTLFAVFVLPQYKKAIVIVTMLAVYTVCGLNFNGQWENLLPALAASFYAVSTYYHDDYVKSRFLMAVGSIFWIMIGFIFHSYAEVISSSISCVSILVGFGRHRRKGLHLQV